jgi:hypothetical protein
MAQVTFSAPGGCTERIEAKMKAVAGRRFYGPTLDFVLPPELPPPPVTQDMDDSA